MPLRRRLPFLLHVTSQAYAIGAKLGPLPAGARMASLNAKQQATEMALEVARPATEPSRMNAVFATAHMDFVHSLLRQGYGDRVYRVEIPDGTNACGPLDMRYVDWLTANGAMPPHPANYWAGDPCPPRVSSWEVVAEALVVVAEAATARVQAAAKRLPALQLGLADLFDP